MKSKKTRKASIDIGIGAAERDRIVQGLSAPLADSCCT